MVDYESVGIFFTVIMMISGNLVVALASQAPTEGIVVSDSLMNMEVQQEDMEVLMDQFNLDMEKVTSKSDIVTQIGFGASAIVHGSQIIVHQLALSLINWTYLIDIMFMGVEGTTLVLVPSVIKLMAGFVMVFTVISFLGRIVKSLPFFGG